MTRSWIWRGRFWKLEIFEWLTCLFKRFICDLVVMDVLGMTFSFSQKTVRWHEFRDGSFGNSKFKRKKFDFVFLFHLKQKNLRQGKKEVESHDLIRENAAVSITGLSRSSYRPTYSFFFLN
jgi:hypothetical protein